MINLSNLFPLGTYPQLKQIQSTLNIASYIVLRYSRRWGSNLRTLDQLCYEIRYTREDMTELEHLNIKGLRFRKNKNSYLVY